MHSPQEKELYKGMGRLPRGEENQAVEQDARLPEELCP